MTRAFVEYREVTVTDPLRQGDVLESTDSGASKWQRHLLVITTDCDFANSKHQGRVTCVPLLRADEYHLEFQVPKIREKFVNKSVSQLQTLLRQAGAPAITERRLREWLIEDDPEVIVDLLGISGSGAIDAMSLISGIRGASAPCGDLDDAVQCLVDAQVGVPDGRKRENVVRDVRDVLRSHYRNPPGDALFLSAIAPSLDSGYFAYLRHLEQIHEPDIAVGPSRAQIAYRRVSRLRDRFILALAQQFALVFMSIGLPQEYEETRELHSELLGDRYQ